MMATPVTVIASTYPNSPYLTISWIDSHGRGMSRRACQSFHERAFSGIFVHRDRLMMYKYGYLFAPMTVFALYHLADDEYCPDHRINNDGTQIPELCNFGPIDNVTGYVDYGTHAVVYSVAYLSYVEITIQNDDSWTLRFHDDYLWLFDWRRPYTRLISRGADWITIGDRDGSDIQTIRTSVRYAELEINLLHRISSRNGVALCIDNVVRRVGCILRIVLLCDMRSGEILWSKLKQLSITGAFYVSDNVVVIHDKNTFTAYNVTDGTKYVWLGV